ncbi:nickel pincer cofactor biosynthesis protein LarC [Maribellus maritimus]|uniref:nickel pincer cofactor biosynthesis protein LarC n=1 Tax=Maribellus maritimus TaxID=2870838 RepID=UPI001EEC1C6B|nr:nickel pincer cofactor biosynthesis protein LarC [Maribellus maritimus]MCG6187929.1 nickel pincer cofactor biosynthesis protein LarC [Maribellus maritimus]
MQRILYYDCFAGISGDMNLGALIHLGVEPEYLKSELKKLNIEGFSLEVKEDKRRGISGIKADVVIKNPENEKHRHLHHIETLVNDSGLPERVKTTALNIFKHVAVAEAKVHNIPIQKVHFHEVGALDSIADIVGAAICLDYLKVDKVLSAPVQLGGGTVKCAHGIMPVPAPATAEILKNIPVKAGLVQYEATTPTGAAILAETVDEFTSSINFDIQKTGYGLGTIDTEVPNVLRVFLAEIDEDKDVIQSDATLLECNMDDLSPENYEFVMDLLFDAGAGDVWIENIIMKKSRPANKLCVLCTPEDSAKMKQILFSNTSTIGLRETNLKKDALPREEKTITTSLGDVKVKQCFYKGELVNTKPEFEDCKRLALENNVSLQFVRELVLKSLEDGSK